MYAQKFSDKFFKIFRKCKNFEKFNIFPKVKIQYLNNVGVKSTHPTQHDRVRTTIKKVHPKFFQNPFLGCPWVVWLGFRTLSALGPFYLIKSLQFLEKITNSLHIFTMNKP